MSWLKRYLSSSIGKKQVVALTGLALVLFLVAHLAGNLQVFDAFGGKAAFNQYAHKLTSNVPLIYVAEAGLLLMFVAHIGFAIKVQQENWAARGPEPYRAVRTRGAPSRRTFASRYMIYSGLLVAAFTVLHLKTFKFGPGFRHEAAYVHEGIRDLHKLTVEVFREPGYVAWYTLAMVVLGLHLQHAISSMFETFGLDHPRWTPFILRGSKAVAWLIAGGFLLIPVLVKLNVGVQP